MGQVWLLPMKTSSSKQLSVTQGSHWEPEHAGLVLHVRTLGFIWNPTGSPEKSKWATTYCKLLETHPAEESCFEMPNLSRKDYHGGRGGGEKGVGFVLILENLSMVRTQEVRRKGCCLSHWVIAMSGNRAFEDELFGRGDWVTERLVRSRERHLWKGWVRSKGEDAKGRGGKWRKPTHRRQNLRH